jgi:spermidine dehydrogenase
MVTIIDRTVKRPCAAIRFAPGADVDIFRAMRSRRGIKRRDFLNGAAFTLGAALLPRGRSAEAGHVVPITDERNYPPALTGLRGSHPGSYEVAHELRDGQVFTPRAHKPEESYDLVVVGGGISGLAAAYFYRRKHGPKAKILVLDNHDDFGGHAKRNEFQVDGHLLLACGGTSSIQNWPSYGAPAQELFRELGIEIPKFKDYYTQDFYQKWNLARSVFLDKETFGADVLVAGEGLPTWEEYAAKLPFSEKARADIVRLQAGREDYLPGLAPDEKLARLKKMSYRAYLLDCVKVDPIVAAYYQAIFHPILGVGIDAVEALLCLPPNQEKALGISIPGRLDGSEIYPFPDGNASIARLLVRALIPDAGAGHTMEDIVATRIDYGALDRGGAPVRIRLNSTAVKVAHVGDPAKANAVDIVYVTNGEAHRVRARGCVLACWHTVVRYLCPEMPTRQKEALAYGVKAGIVFTQLALKNWTALHKLGVRSVYCPGSYYASVRMNHPVTMGGYRFAVAPEEPLALLMVHVPTTPGLSQREQRRAGHLEILATPFEIYEGRAYDQLDRMFGTGGFEAKRDVAAITVNRWTHGYAYEYSSLWDPDWAPDERPNVVASRPFGRITIANSDAHAKSQTWAAIGEAHRAVEELG